MIPPMAPASLITLRPPTSLSCVSAVTPDARHVDVCDTTTHKQQLCQRRNRTKCRKTRPCRYPGTVSTGCFHPLLRAYRTDGASRQGVYVSLPRAMHQCMAAPAPSRRTDGHPRVREHRLTAAAIHRYISGELADDTVRTASVSAEPEPRQVLLQDSQIRRQVLMPLASRYRSGTSHFLRPAIAK
jgi:hypothetical protein